MQELPARRQIQIATELLDVLRPGHRGQLAARVLEAPLGIQVERALAQLHASCAALRMRRDQLVHAADPGVTERALQEIEPPGALDRAREVIAHRVAEPIE